MKKVTIVFGSSRSNGNTMIATKQIMEKINHSLLINLADYDINDFDYEHKNINDDFLKITKIILEYDVIILATPIYWYTMSASMKRFVDRITDLLTVDKNSGRVLRNKKLAIISSYATHPEGKDGFEPVFINIAQYLGMKYLGCYFHYSGDIQEVQHQNKQHLTEFIDLIRS